MKVCRCLLTCLLLAGSLQTQAQPPSQEVQAIVGESCNQPYRTQLAVASALRNRETLKGVIGLKNQSMIQKQSLQTFQTAARAWSESATNNIVHGATHFESNNFPTPYWAKHMKLVATVGKFNFYKRQQLNKISKNISSFVLTECCHRINSKR